MRRPAVWWTCRYTQAFLPGRVELQASSIVRVELQVSSDGQTAVTKVVKSGQTAGTYGQSSEVSSDLGLQHAWGGETVVKKWYKGGQAMVERWSHRLTIGRGVPGASV